MSDEKRIGWGAYLRLLEDLFLQGGESFGVETTNRLREDWLSGVPVEVTVRRLASVLNSNVQVWLKREPPVKTDIDWLPDQIDEIVKIGRAL